MSASSETTEEVRGDSETGCIHDEFADFLRTQVVGRLRGNPNVKRIEMIGQGGGYDIEAYVENWELSEISKINREFLEIYDLVIERFPEGCFDTHIWEAPSPYESAPEELTRDVETIYATD